VPDLPSELDQIISSRGLLKKGDCVIVAVSGGLDSIVLLDLLIHLATKKKNNWRLHVAHLNHRLRGRESDADAALVRKTAARAGLKFHLGSANVRKLASSTGISIEMAARKLRHEFLAKIARQQNAQAIALAHHGDDQVEQFFLRLFRGSGAEALAGMKWRSPSPADRRIAIVRPLLSHSKAALLKYAASEGIVFREDVTNASLDFERNRIRHELLPFLQKKFHPSLAAPITRIMEIVGPEAEVVSGIARAWIQANNFDKKRPSKVRLEADAFFNSLPIAVQRKIIEAQLWRLGLEPDFDAIEYLRKNEGKRLSMNQDLVQRTQTGQIQQVHPDPKPSARPTLNVELRKRAGNLAFAGLDISWRVIPWPPKVGQTILSALPSAPRPNGTSEFFDADALGSRIVLRHWQPGDRYQPIGGVSQKLQDIFINAKIPKAQRHRLIVATTRKGQIFWVENLRIADRFKLTPKTSRCLEWRVTRRV
jgi:tRNA(Ile)-lysidine synthase